MKRKLELTPKNVNIKDMVEKQLNNEKNTEINEIISV